MTPLIDLKSPTVAQVLPILLQDKTTKKNIVWATDSYVDLGEGYQPNAQMGVEALTKMNDGLLQPRVFKAQAEQLSRTRSKAEVFTPSWICNQMNNYLDEDWFGREGVFNVSGGQTWTPTTEPIVFPKQRHARWQQYVDSRRLEITCGEAPFIVSRYDAATGEYLPIPQRIGLLDRKLRVVGENVGSEADWVKWAVRAVQSVYGYEYQGDNLLIARVNVLMTFVEYLGFRWQRDVTGKELKALANVVAWNFWQMDGLTGTAPFGTIKAEAQNEVSMVSLGWFDEIDRSNGYIANEAQAEMTPPCKIYDWRKDCSVTWDALKKR